MKYSKIRLNYQTIDSKTKRLNFVERCFIDILDFAARSEWPIVTITGLILARGPLIKMIERISPTKIDIFGVKAEFVERLDKAESLVSNISEEISLQGKSFHEEADADSILKSDIEQEKLQISENSHNDHLKSPIVIVEKRTGTRILRSWNRMAKQLNSIYKNKFNEQINVGWDKPEWIQKVEKMEILSNDDICALKELQVIRNWVARDEFSSLSAIDASRFGALAWQIKKTLQMATSLLVLARN